MARSRPRFGELEVPDPRNSSEVSTVVGHEDQPRLTARQRQEDVVPKRLREAAQLQPFASYEVGQNDPRLFPCAGRGCNDAPSARKHVQHAALELAEIGVCVPASSSCATRALRNSNGANKRWNLWSSALAAGARNDRMKKFV